MKRIVEQACKATNWQSSRTLIEATVKATLDRVSQEVVTTAGNSEDGLRLLHILWGIKRSFDSGFKIGSTVSWTSSRKEKVGEIVAVVPIFRKFGEIEEELKEGGLVFRSKNSGTMDREHESYAVLVPNGDRKPKLYWPVVKMLEIVK